MIFPQCYKDSSQKHCVISALQKDFGFTALSKALPCSQSLIPSVLLAQAEQGKQNFPQQPPLGTGITPGWSYPAENTGRTLRFPNPAPKANGDQAKPAGHQHQEKSWNPGELQEQLPGDTDPGLGCAGIPRARGCSRPSWGGKERPREG